MQEAVFANIQGENLLLLTRRGKHCDYLKLRKSGQPGRDWSDVVGAYLYANQEALFALKQGKTISV